MLVDMNEDEGLRCLVQPILYTGKSWHDNFEKRNYGH